MGPLYLLLGILTILTLANLILFFNGISKAKLNWGNTILFIITSIVLPFIITGIAKKIEDKLDLLVYTYLYSFLVVQLIALAFLYKRFKKG